ncbi:MAG: right-handed parallel beta-helix repeat-containing protein [Streptosporangiaceae bacterium]
MTTKPDDAANIPAERNSPASPASGSPAPPRRRRRMFLLAVLSFAALATVAVLAAVSNFFGLAAGLTNCANAPSNCSYPGPANTGVPAGTTLKAVPAQVSSGPGWSYSAATNTVVVTTKGTVLSDLSITGLLQVNASNVTVNDVKVVTSATFGISLTHTAGVTIENSTISGQNSTTGRVGSAIDDVYGDSTGMTIQNDNISSFRTAIQISSGLVTGNYIHDPGYVAGDHTNGIYVNGGTQPLTISGNTIFDSLGQTDAINLDAGTPGPAAPVANKTITNNFLAGGSYTIYGGDASGSPTTNIIITGNRFGQLYYAKSGQYGPAVYYDSAGTGNSWSGNTWDTTGQTVPSP